MELKSDSTHSSILYKYCFKAILCTRCVSSGSNGKDKLVYSIVLGLRNHRDKTAERMERCLWLTVTLWELRCKDSNECFAGTLTKSQRKPSQDAVRGWRGVLTVFSANVAPVFSVTLVYMTHEYPVWHCVPAFEMVSKHELWTQAWCVRVE